MAKSQPSRRFLSLNINRLRGNDKRRSLFNLLLRDQWDVILLQETHHSSRAEGEERAQEGSHGLCPHLGRAKLLESWHMTQKTQNTETQYTGWQTLQGTDIVTGAQAGGTPWHMLYF
jgi:endonuclease/exonuclease/phosphatase family metal-dependent hydrolase